MSDARKESMPGMREPHWAAVEAELRRVPAVRPGAIDQVMAEVLASRIEPVPARPRPLGWLTARSVAPWQAMAASLLIAAGAYAFAARDPRHTDVAISPAPALTPPDAGRPTQFVFVSTGARAVTLVGDFNDWNPEATPLRRTSTEGVWSIVVPLAPGRHVYAFVVDGAHWMPDASAPRAPEDEFGGGNSVVLVGGRS